MPGRNRYQEYNIRKGSDRLPVYHRAPPPTSGSVARVEHGAWFRCRAFGLRRRQLSRGPERCSTYGSVNHNQRIRAGRGSLGDRWGQSLVQQITSHDETVLLSLFFKERGDPRARHAPLTVSQRTPPRHLRLHWPARQSTRAARRSTGRQVP